MQGRPEIIRRARDGALRPHLGRSLLVRPPAACGRPVQAAARNATPCSHGPSECPTLSRPALRSRTRNVAWNASSMSWGSRRIRRQTRSTIGPCRSISAEKADSPSFPPPSVNRCNNSSSVSPPTAPSLNSACMCRRGTPYPPFDTSLVLRVPRPIPRSNVARDVVYSNFSGNPRKNAGIEAASQVGHRWDRPDGQTETNAAIPVPRRPHPLLLTVGRPDRRRPPRTGHGRYHPPGRLPGRPDGTAIRRTPRVRIQVRKTRRG